MAMTPRTKVLLSIMTFVMAFAIAYAGIYPAFSELQLRTTDVKERRQENQQYVNKLLARAKADLDRRKLEEQILNLRKAVPKQPELDLVMLDLENMCRDSKVDLIGVENIDPDILAKMQAKEKPKNSANGANLFKPLVAPLAMLNGKSDQKKDATDVAEQSSFKELSKEVYVTGDYDGFVRMMHKMETYQRVIGFNNIVISVPAKEVKDASAVKAEKLKIKQPIMSFILTIYYLP